jgi:hypothetical protein
MTPIGALSRLQRSASKSGARLPNCQIRPCPVRCLGLVPPSHGENRGSSPLGSANDFNDLVALEGLTVGDISNFSPMDGAFEDWFEATMRSSARGGRRLAQSRPSRHRCLLIKMTRARIAARSAEQIEPIDALLAPQAAATKNGAPTLRALRRRTTAEARLPLAVSR